ncbi:MAG: transposase [Acidimicrobiales bacterium]
MEKKRTGYQRYPSELKERAVRMVLDLQRSDPSDKSVIARVARQLGVGGESLRIWVKQAQIDAGTRGGLTSEEREELKRLRKENFELQRANDILQAAATFMSIVRLCRLPIRTMTFDLFGAGGRW